MSCGTKEAKNCLTRRRLVQLSLLGAFSAAEASAQETPPVNTEAPWTSFKATKAQARYIDKEEPGTQSCSTCHSFIEPTDCLLVESPVSPWGWCDWFSD
jgi:hypothetical protein